MGALNEENESHTGFLKGAFIRIMICSVFLFTWKNTTWDDLVSNRQCCIAKFWCQN